MASQALESASKYLNNLLLARGLLQDGKPISFANPTDDSNTADQTISRTINLVHDLILRRDRDADQKEALAANIHHLRSEEKQRILDLQKAQDRNIQLQNDTATAEAQQRVLETTVKKAEQQMKELREQMVKMKLTLDQVRAKCVGDVRKRDVEIEKLKNHLNSMQRGRKDTGGMKVHVLNLQQPLAGRQRRCGEEVNGEWTLDNETNDFLAALVDEASTENVALRKIVNDSISYLKSLTGPEVNINREADVVNDEAGIPGQYRKSRQPLEHAESLIPVQTLATEMTRILEHCREILKDPSFVPIEEVQIREEEIQKLRAGWEKMADRWKEAVTMMSQWRQRMVPGGKEDEHDNKFESDQLSGLGGFGRSVAMRPDGQPVLGSIEEEELSSILFDYGKVNGESAREMNRSLLADVDHFEPESEGTPFQLKRSLDDCVDESESDLDLSEQPSLKKRLVASPAKRGIKLPRPVVKPLSETNANARHPNPAKNSKSEAEKTLDNFEHISEESTDEEENYAELYQPQQMKSRLPRLTVAEKLAAIEAEANEATQDLRRRQATQKRKPVERDKKGRKSNKRRSTLNPEELAQLMGV